MQMAPRTPFTHFPSLKESSRAFLQLCTIIQHNSRILFCNGGAHPSGLKRGLFVVGPRCLLAKGQKTGRGEPSSSRALLKASALKVGGELLEGEILLEPLNAVVRD